MTALAPSGYEWKTIDDIFPMHGRSKFISELYEQSTPGGQSENYYLARKIHECIFDHLMANVATSPADLLSDDLCVEKWPSYQQPASYFSMYFLLLDFQHIAANTQYKLSDLKGVDLYNFGNLEYSVYPDDEDNSIDIHLPAFSHRFKNIIVEEKIMAWIGGEWRDDGPHYSEKDVFFFHKLAM